jgi:hypothetical protein
VFVLFVAGERVSVRTDVAGIADHVGQHAFYFASSAL